MPYVISPDAVAIANAAAFKRLADAERRTLQRHGDDLDATFNAVWNPLAPATVAGVVSECGTNFLGRCDVHYRSCLILLEQEKANGIDSSKHPWARKQPDGSFVPGIQIGWTVTPTLDAQGQPTGAATVTRTLP